MCAHLWIHETLLMAVVYIIMVIYDVTMHHSHIIEKARRGVYFISKQLNSIAITVTVLFPKVTLQDECINVFCVCWLFSTSTYAIHIVIGCQYNIEQGHWPIHRYAYTNIYICSPCLRPFRGLRMIIRSRPFYFSTPGYVQTLSLSRKGKETNKAGLF